jgi:hypothetical protein
MECAAVSSRGRRGPTSPESSTISPAGLRPPGGVDVTWLLIRSASDQPRCFGERRARTRRCHYAGCGARAGEVAHGGLGSSVLSSCPWRVDSVFPCGKGLKVALGRWASSTRHGWMMVSVQRQAVRFLRRLFRIAPIQFCQTEESYCLQVQGNNGGATTFQQKHDKDGQEHEVRILWLCMIVHASTLA